MTEVVLVNNEPHRLIYENPRVNVSLDMAGYGDEEYVTVGDLRTMVNTSRKFFDNFQLLIVDILDDEYTLEDLLQYLGLSKAYEEYFSLSNDEYKQISSGDIKQFIIDSDFDRFDKFMDSCGKNLRRKIIEITVILFKKKEFGDYNKMQIVRKYAGDEVFLDAEKTDIDEGIQI